MKVIFTGNEWIRPLVPLNAYNNETVSINSGEGSVLFDESGNSYIDCNSGLWNISMGYNNRRIVSAIEEQLKLIPYVNTSEINNSLAAKLAKKICGLTNGRFSRCFYTCSGSESVELAVKICRQYHALSGKENKNIIVTINSGYHGTTYAALTASGLESDATKPYIPLVDGFQYLECFDKDDDNIIKNINNMFKNFGERIAGIIFEPIIASGGIWKLSDKVFKELFKQAQKYDVLLVADEVATGFGRTGNMFAYENLPDCSLDMLCFSKGADSGYIPFGGVLISEKVSEVYVLKQMYINHMSTQDGNLLGCAAASAVIDILCEDGFLESVREKSELLNTLLIQSISEHPNVHDIRVYGLMAGISLVYDNEEHEKWSFDDVIRLKEALFYKGLIVYPMFEKRFVSGLFLFPPLTISEEELTKIVNIIKSVFSRNVF